MREGSRSRHSGTRNSEPERGTRHAGSPRRPALVPRRSNLPQSLGKSPPPDREPAPELHPLGHSRPQRSWQDLASNRTVRADARDRQGRCQNVTHDSALQGILSSARRERRRLRPEEGFLRVLAAGPPSVLCEHRSEPGQALQRAEPPCQSRTGPWFKSSSCRPPGRARFQNRAGAPLANSLGTSRIVPLSLAPPSDK